MRSLVFVVIAVLLLVALLGAAAVYYRRARRSAGASWEELLGRLVPVDRDSIALIAEDAEEGSASDSDAMDPQRIWALLGGLDGLELLEHNCRVLVDLAAYVQRWYPEALVVAEQLRLNAREIEWHVSRLKGAAQTGNLEACFADYAQRATLTYYRMTQHVLELYRQAGLAQFAELQSAI